MKHVVFAAMCVLCLSACRNTSAVYETADLVSLTHNNANNYTLVVYRTQLGETRQVLRRKGVVELIVIRYDDGEMFLKERGREAREIGHQDMVFIQRKIEVLMFEGDQQSGVADLGDTF